MSLNAYKQDFEKLSAASVSKNRLVLTALDILAAAAESVIPDPQSSQVYCTYIETGRNVYFSEFSNQFQAVFFSEKVSCDLLRVWFFDEYIDFQIDTESETQIWALHNAHRVLMDEVKKCREALCKQEQI